MGERKRWGNSVEGGVVFRVGVGLGIGGGVMVKG